MFNDNIPGYAQGNNIAMRFAKGKYIFLLNNDNEVTYGWELPLIKALEEHPSIGWIGPTILWGDDVVQSAGAMVTKDAASISVWSGTKYEKIKGQGLINCHYLGFGMYRKELTANLGYLSEEYKHIYFDDTDFGLKVQSAGFRVCCSLDCAIYHKMSDKERQRWVDLDPYSINQPVFKNKWKEWLEENSI